MCRLTLLLRMKERRSELNELSTLPAYEERYFYRRIAELAAKYLENPENRQRFEEWKGATQNVRSKNDNR